MDAYKNTFGLCQLNLFVILANSYGGKINEKIWKKIQWADKKFILIGMGHGHRHTYSWIAIKSLILSSANFSQSFIHL
jgi:hypothetical protein